jgi:hypothetical protein
MSAVCVSSPVRIFADDCLVYRSINKVEDTAALQNDMSALQQWESDWQMMFHPEKCKVGPGLCPEALLNQRLLQLIFRLLP